MQGNGGENQKHTQETTMDEKDDTIKPKTAKNQENTGQEGGSGLCTGTNTKTTTAHGRICCERNGTSVDFIHCKSEEMSVYRQWRQWKNFSSESLFRLQWTIRHAPWPKKHQMLQGGDDLKAKYFCFTYRFKASRRYLFAKYHRLGLRQVESGPEFNLLWHKRTTHRIKSQQKVCFVY